MLETIILLGAPGSGKGTIAEELTNVTEYIHVSTGDMLREAVKAEHEVGLKAKKYMDEGELVPDDVIMEIVRERLDRGPDEAHYMFDGFPRTIEQAQLLDAVLTRDGRGRVAHVFLLEVPEEVVVDRLEGRRVCRGCGAVYHVRNIPPEKEGVCDECGGELYQRKDDDKNTVLNRLDVFRKQAEELINYYDGQGVLRRIDALDREKTVQAILAVLNDSTETHDQD